MEKDRLLELLRCKCANSCYWTSILSLAETRPLDSGVVVVVGQDGFSSRHKSAHEVFIGETVTLAVKLYLQADSFQRMALNFAISKLNARPIARWRQKVCREWSGGTKNNPRLNRDGRLLRAIVRGCDQSRAFRAVGELHLFVAAARIHTPHTIHFAYICIALIARTPLVSRRLL